MSDTEGDVADPEDASVGDQDQRRRRSDGLIVALNDSVVAMSQQLVDMSAKLEGFTTTGEVNKKVSELESRLRFRTTVLAVVVVVFAATFAWYSNYRANQSTKQQFAALAIQRHQSQLENCATQNGQNQSLHDIVDKSLQQQASIDPSKLSPTAQEILLEFARASAAAGAGQASFRDFVFARTPIVNCAKKFPPLTKAKPKPTTVKPKTTTTRPKNTSA